MYFPAAVWLVHCMVWFFFVVVVVGLIAVALTKKEEKLLNESSTPAVQNSLILFYSFSDPSNPQVWKVYERPSE